MRPGSGLALLAGTLAACGPAPPANRATDGGGGASCTASKRCDGLVLSTCQDGDYVPVETCPSACDAVLGCVVCEPGSASCSGDTSYVCAADGSGYTSEVCDPVQGVTCNVETGRCDGQCAPHLLGQSYIGCEYYPTITGNAVGNDFAFAVAISNTSTSVASITIEGGALTAPVTLTVEPGKVATQDLPWIHELKMCTGPTSNDCLTPVVYAAKVTDGAYHLRSTAPVTVYQFSPLEYTNGVEFSYTNDASLLLPTNAWTGNYMAATMRRWDANQPDTWPGMMTITAAQDATSVTITTTATTAPYGLVTPFIAGVPKTVTLNSGDVLQIAAFGHWGSSLDDDLTGSIVAADKPVQLVTAHFCTYLPDRFHGACDHLEETMLPVEALSTRYLVTPPAIANIPDGKEQIVRIVAVEANTTITYDPPQADAPTTIAAAGGFIDIPPVAADYMVTADHKVLVMQYMLGQDQVSNQGDPAMAIAVPVDQYRTSYQFHAPANYEANYVNVTAPTEAMVLLDGAPIATLTPIGATGFGVARIQLTSGPAADGNHTISSTQAFGISVYGYGQYTSYWYAGGLDLASIPID